MKKALLKDIGRRIREKRQLAGFSQGDVAKAFGCAQSRISAIENGTRDPGVDFLTWFAEKMGAPLDYILLGFDVPNKEVVMDNVTDFIADYTKKLMKFVAEDKHFVEEVGRIIKIDSPTTEMGHSWLTGEEKRLIDLVRKNPDNFNEVFQLAWALDKKKPEKNTEGS